MHIWNAFIQLQILFFFCPHPNWSILPHCYKYFKRLWSRDLSRLFCLSSLRAHLRRKRSQEAILVPVTKAHTGDGRKRHHPFLLHWPVWCMRGSDSANISRPISSFVFRWTLFLHAGVCEHESAECVWAVFVSVPSVAEGRGSCLTAARDCHL